MIMSESEKSAIVDSARATYAGTSGNYVSFYHDASENEEGSKGAFAEMTRAIGQAREFVFMTGWSFHPDCYLRRDEGARTIGELLIERAREESGMAVALMSWFHKGIRPDEPLTGDLENNLAQERLQELAGKEGLPENVLWRSSPYDKANIDSHHKFLVCDAPADEGNPEGARVLKAFFWWIDISKGRFDWPEHPFLPGGRASSENAGRAR